MESEFIKIYRQHIKRDGADKLLEWLQGTDFFKCPASTKFHNNFEGGLAEHSVNVYKRLCKFAAAEKLKATEESLAVIGLLHDICKADTYKTEMRNVKENGEWVQKPYYTTDDKLPYGHGEKSVYIIGGFMKLSREEAMAINWHMGPYDARNQGSPWVLSSAFQMYPLALLTFLADISATYLDEEIK